MKRTRTPTDEVPTEIFESGEYANHRTTEAATKVGKRPTKAAPVVVPELDEPTEKTKEPIVVISMKTPDELEAEKHSKVIVRPQLRAISEVHRVPAADLGNLARPRIEQARRRRMLTNIGWGIAVIAIALVVAIALWFVMQRR
jgi:hypothetical protein